MSFLHTFRNPEVFIFPYLLFTSVLRASVPLNKSSILVDAHTTH